tara:strand:+ start:132 stop:530 length:399 start_codon:yes stop_codon:yes gene_type:complete
MKREKLDQRLIVKGDFYQLTISPSNTRPSKNTVILDEVKNLIQLRYLIERKVNPNNLKPTRIRTIPLKEGVQGEDLADFIQSSDDCDERLSFGISECPNILTHYQQSLSQRTLRNPNALPRQRRVPTPSIVL